MKKILSVIIVAALSLCVCACGGGAYETGGDGPCVITTVFPAFDFARELSGGRANICMLVPPGSEAHSFEPTAQDILKIQSCDLLICNGGESEAWLEEVLDGLDGEIRVLYMLDCVEAVEEEIKEGMQTTEHAHEEHEKHDEHEETEYDEHVWTSPVNAVKICEAIAQCLSECDKENSELYEKCLSEYTQKLMELDRSFRDAVEGSGRRTLIFADRFPVRYFTEEYGLDYFAAFPGCADDTEPSAKTVAFLIDKVKQEHCPAVFYIEFSNQRMADIVCEDTGCKKLLFHSCHNVSRDELLGGVSYVELMQGNITALKEALA